MSEKVIPKSYLTPNQVAELLMVTPTAVRQWAKKGDLNALTTPGGHRRFLPDEIQRFAREKNVTLNQSYENALRILIVGSDTQFTYHLVQLLEGLQKKIVTGTANDSFSTGLKLNEFQPHVILLDLTMPGLDSFQVCRILKKSPHTKEIRIIAMTGNLSAENDERILSAGAEVCLSKPVEKNQLFNLLNVDQGNSNRI